LMNGPTIQPMLKPYQNVMKLFQSMHIPVGDVMVTEDEYRDNLNKLAQQETPPSDAVINAQSRVEAAQIAADSRRDAGDLQFQIAQLRERTAMVELANTQGMTIETLRNELEKLDRKLASDERIKAVEVAVEDERAERARVEGRPQDLATGKEIG
jgi:hypothetical protein